MLLIAGSIREREREKERERERETERERVQKFEEIYFNSFSFTEIIGYIYRIKYQIGR